MSNLYVRFGVPVDGPRKVETFTFNTEGEQRAFIDGLYALHSRGDVEYDIAQSPDEPDPEWDDEDEEEDEG